MRNENHLQALSAIKLQLISEGFPLIQKSLETFHLVGISKAYQYPYNFEIINT